MEILIYYQHSRFKKKAFTATLKFLVTATELNELSLFLGCWGAAGLGCWAGTIWGMRSSACWAGTSVCWAGTIWRMRSSVCWAWTIWRRWSIRWRACTVLGGCSISFTSCWCVLRLSSRFSSWFSSWQLTFWINNFEPFKLNVDKFTYFLLLWCNLLELLRLIMAEEFENEEITIWLFKTARSAYSNSHHNTE